MANEEIKSYRDLIVWQKAVAMVTYIYKVSQGFPQDEMYGLRSQIRRAGVSVPSNIAEGFGRRSSADFARFLRVAVSSLYELQTHLEIALNLGYVTEELIGGIQGETVEVEKMLCSLIGKLK